MPGDKSMSTPSPAEQLSVLVGIVRQFALTSLAPTLQACASLAQEDMPLDVAVLGQFKSGKSSLLNAVLGEPLFPVGALPVTAVITRAAAGPQRLARVIHCDGSVEEIDPGRLADFVTEAGNPTNQRQVAVVDVLTPALTHLPGVRLVDTPGLGSVLAHNTEATRAWMPNVAVALVAVSAERPLSNEDRRLVEEARQTAPRVVVILTKVDLLTEEERSQVADFLDRALQQSLGAGVPVLPVSTRATPERFVEQLLETVLRPVARDVAGERRAALRLKLAALAQACRGYLLVGLQAVERTEAERDRLRAAVLDESVNAAVIRDELRLAALRVCSGARAAFEQLFLAQRPAVEQRLSQALAADIPTWQGNLARQTQHYQTWMTRRLTDELSPLSRSALPLAEELLRQAEGRFRRVVEAFRDRFSRNIHEATGVTISPAAWEVKRPEAAVVPVAVSQAFMTNWELLWWMLPMWLIGGLFRRHLLGRVPWEAEKNLFRLAADWSEAVGSAVADLEAKASDWVESELATLSHLLGGPAAAPSAAFQDALRRLEETATPPAP
jgi:GTP-binding protein EngB required for normal cell division